MIIVWLGQTSKPAGVMVILSIVAMNQPVSRTTQITNGSYLYFNVIVVILIIYQVCVEAFPLIFPMLIYMLDFGGDSICGITKYLVNKYPSAGLHKNILDSKSVLYRHILNIE